MAVQYTQADIDALKAKITAFAGTKSTRFGDQATEFDLEGAMKLLAVMEQSVAAQAGGSKTRYASTSKGV